MTENTNTDGDTAAQTAALSELADRIEEYTDDLGVARDIALTVADVQENTVLSNRQAQVVALDKMGFLIAEIADILDVEKRTVSQYKSNAKNRIEEAETTVALLSDADVVESSDTRSSVLSRDT